MLIHLKEKAGALPTLTLLRLACLFVLKGLKSDREACVHPPIPDFLSFLGPSQQHAARHIAEANVHTSAFLVFETYAAQTHKQHARLPFLDLFCGPRCLGLLCER